MKTTITVLSYGSKVFPNATSVENLMFYTGKEEVPVTKQVFSVEEDTEFEFVAEVKKEINNSHGIVLKITISYDGY